MMGRLRFSLPRISAAQRARKGGTAVEMALIAPVFFLLLIGMTEIGLMVTAQQLMENATFNTSRLAKTGYAEAGQTQLQTVTQVLNQELGSFGLLIDTSKVTMTSQAYNTFTAIGSGAGTNGMGATAQIVVYTVSYPWKIFTPMMNVLIGTDGFLPLTARIVVRNEPF